jgi:hypothetical protein
MGRGSGDVVGWQQVDNGEQYTHRPYYGSHKFLQLVAPLIFSPSNPLLLGASISVIEFESFGVNLSDLVGE